MGIFDKAKDAAGNVSPDQMKDGVTKGGDFIDDKTGGKYADKVDQGQNFANEQIDDRFGGKQAEGQRPDANH